MAINAMKPPNRASSFLTPKLSSERNRNLYRHKSKKSINDRVQTRNSVNPFMKHGTIISSSLRVKKRNELGLEGPNCANKPQLEISYLLANKFHFPAKFLMHPVFILLRTIML
jgi:hypothetical protein